MTRCFTLLLLIISALEVFGQFGPNLTTGAEGLVYKQGELDAQLILDIIATKKGEIKNELGKRLILNKLEGGSFAFYNYVEKSLNLLYSEGNKQVITKEFMKNSAELVLVYGIAEYILQDIHPDYIKRTGAENNLLRMLIMQAGSSNRDSLLAQYFPLIPNSDYKSLNELFSKLLQNDQGDFSSAADTFVQANKKSQYVASSSKSSCEYLLKPERLAKFDNGDNRKYQESKNNYYSATSMLVDLVYDVCINNAEVKSAGMFQSQNILSDQYRLISKYHFFNKPNSQFIFKPLNAYRNKIDAILTNLFRYYNLFKEINEIWADTTWVNGKIRSAKNTSPEALDSLAKFIKLNVNRVDKGHAVSLENESIYEDEIYANGLIQNLPKFLNTSKSGGQLAAYYLDLAYNIKKEIIPILSTLNSRNGRYTPVLDSLESLYGKLFTNALALFGNDQQKIRKVIDRLDNYLPLIDIINNLDKVESYDKVFKFLTGLSETFGDKKTQAVVQSLTIALDKYTAINEEENKLSMDVEGMAVDLYERFAKNQHSRLSMMFTVGVNHNIADKGDLDFFKKSDGTTSDFSQFVSEKIGIRWNMLDWNRARSFNENPFSFQRRKKGNNKVKMSRALRSSVEPIVNNFHLIFYGSGLLYKINALNSTEDFTKPIFGVGCGVTFFNGLDFNFSRASVNNLQFDKSFWSLSFDISITEYLSALKKKNKK